MASYIFGELQLVGILKTLFVMGVFVLLTKLIQWIIKVVKINKALSAFPSVSWHWLYGSLKQARKGHGANNFFLKMHLDRCKRHPRAYKIWQGPVVANLLAVHPDTIRPVLKAADPKGKVYDISLKPWLGTTLKQDMTAEVHWWNVYLRSEDVAVFVCPNHIIDRS